MRRGVRIFIHHVGKRCAVLQVPALFRECRCSVLEDGTEQEPEREKPGTRRNKVIDGVERHNRVGAVRKLANCDRKDKEPSLDR